MASELKEYQVTDNRDNEFEIKASALTIEDNWLKFYDGTSVVAAFFRPAGFILTEE